MRAGRAEKGTKSGQTPWESRPGKTMGTAGEVGDGEEGWGEAAMVAIKPGEHTGHISKFKSVWMFKKMGSRFLDVKVLFPPEIRSLPLLRFHPVISLLNSDLLLVFFVVDRQCWTSFKSLQFEFRCPEMNGNPWLPGRTEDSVLKTLNIQ